MRGTVTNQAELWEILQKRMPVGEVVDLNHIYTWVEKEITLKPGDFLPENKKRPESAPAWKRNVRNVLQRRRTTRDVEYLGNERYMLPVTKDDAQTCSSVPLRAGISEEAFKRLKEMQAEVGLMGELFVLEHERKALYDDGMTDLAKRVTRVSEVDIGLGYDIESFDRSGRPKYIEVKATTGRGSTFELTRKELEAARRIKEQYWIYHIKEIGDDMPTLVKMQNPAGSIGTLLDLEPSAYTVKIR